MSVSDYSTRPSDNAYISGINIAEGCPPSGINNAIRQLMADIKISITNIENNYLPKRGTSGHFYIQTNDSTTGGAGLYLSDGPSGWFQLRAADGTDNCQLYGLPDGTLTWGPVGATGNTVVTVAASGDGYVRYSDGRQICWGTATVAAGSKQVTLPTSFIAGKWRATASATTAVAVGVSINDTARASFYAVTTGGATIQYIAVGLWK